MNSVPQGETSQMTPEEKAALITRLKEAQERQASAGDDPKSYSSEIERLENLARTHAQDTLDDIEEEQQ